MGLASTTFVRAETLVALTSGNRLLFFDSATPGTIASTIGISGLQGGENVLGIDFRPANGQLYGLGSAGHIYTINTTTGAATLVSTLSSGLSGSGWI